MPKWIWLDEYQRYRDLETGRWVGASQIREWGSLAADASSHALAELADMLNDGRLNTHDWTLLMRDEIKDVYIQQYVLGKGGLDQMTQADWGSLGGMLREQYRYLDRFAVQIAAGQVAPGQIVQRSRMYGNSAREAHSRAHERALGMPPLPDHPGSGNTLCLTNCRCYWNIEPVRDRGGNVTSWRCTWMLTLAEHCTAPGQFDAQGRPIGCIQRADLWNPLILEAR